MITGPAGSGKEVIARLIHDNSYRSNGPFVVVNSSMMRPDSLEMELNLSKLIVVDFAGNSDYLEKIHNYFGDLLKYVCLVGLADWSSRMDFKSIPNSKFFFAPSHAENRYKKMGVKETMLLADNLMQEFIMEIKNCLKLTYVEGRIELHKLYLKFLKGKIDPSKAYIVQSVE